MTVQGGGGDRAHVDDLVVFRGDHNALPLVDARPAMDMFVVYGACTLGSSIAA